MFLAVLSSDGRVADLFDTERHIDEGVTGVEMPVEIYQQVCASGWQFADWVYNGGTFVFDPLPKLNPKNSEPSPIPQSVL